MAKNNSRINGFAYSHIGTGVIRENEDRCFWGNFTTMGGLEISVAIVSDGVGGGSLGQRAAQVTVDIVKGTIKESIKSENEIPQILGFAVGSANKVVYRESRAYELKNGMAATVSIAAVCNGRLYVANVGDSRIYLIQDSKDIIRGKVVRQITVDHTYANKKIRQGISPERIYRHPNANHIVRAVGFESNIIVDLGLYLDGGREDGQRAYFNQGMQLDKNDVILVCSDGLTKEMLEAGSRHYVEDDEIIDVISRYRAEQAAKVLVDLTLGRDVDDNVTAIVLEYDDRKISRFSRRSLLLFGIWTLFVICLTASLYLTLLQVFQVQP